MEKLRARSRPWLRAQVWSVEKLLSLEEAPNDLMAHFLTSSRTHSLTHVLTHSLEKLLSLEETVLSGGGLHGPSLGSAALVARDARGA